MTEPDEGERLQSDLALLGLLEDAVNGVATYARGVCDVVQTLDSRRAPGASLRGAVPGLDAERARLVAAARRGPADAALALGKAARRPARLALPETEPKPYAGMGDAARAAAALLAAIHHDVEGVDASHLMGDADPVRVAVLLAQIAVNLAADAVPDVGEWLARVGAAWASEG